MFGIPVQMYTATREYREFLRSQPKGNSRHVTLIWLGFLHLPITAGVAWAWLHDYPALGYGLSILMIMTGLLGVLLMIVFGWAIVQVRRDSRDTSSH